MQVGHNYIQLFKSFILQLIMTCFFVTGKLFDEYKKIY